jgi:hypothetical protein
LVGGGAEVSATDQRRNLNAFSAKEMRFFIWAQPFDFYKVIAIILTQ